MSSIRKIADGDMRELAGFGIRSEVVMPRTMRRPDGGTATVPIRPTVGRRQAVVEFSDGDVFVFHEAARGKIEAITHSTRAGLCVQQRDAIGLMLPRRVVTLRVLELPGLVGFGFVAFDEASGDGAAILAIWTQGSLGSIEWHPTGFHPTWLASALEFTASRPPAPSFTAAAQCAHGAHWAKCDACDSAARVRGEYSNDRVMITAPPARPLECNRDGEVCRLCGARHRIRVQPAPGVRIDGPPIDGPIERR